MTTCKKVGRKIILVALLFALTLASCDAVGVEVKPFFLPIALVFSSQGVEVQLDFGVDIPYLGTVSLVAPLNEIAAAAESSIVFVTMDGETYQYDLQSPTDGKFEGVLCKTGCEINVDMLPTGNIHLDVKKLFEDPKTIALLHPYSGNYEIDLVVLVPSLNIRKGPGPGYEEIGGAYQGDVLKSDYTAEIAQEGGDVWVRVLVPPGNYGAGSVGWVNMKYTGKK